MLLVQAMKLDDFLQPLVKQQKAIARPVSNLTHDRRSLSAPWRT
ncbi:MAG TPA: hypothetical protein V6D34_16105 [Candidatus Sericytochromatia bacterium]